MNNDRIIALDPGGTTGVAAYDLSYPPESALMYATELTEDRHHRDLWELLCNYLPGTVVCERFDYRNYGQRGQKRKGVDLSAREYIGVADLYCQVHGAKLVMQSPLAHDKGIWQDKYLKQAGILVEPASKFPHANDALRHLMLYLAGTTRFIDHKEYWLSFRKGK